jgi:segregation and condensation protein B
MLTMEKIKHIVEAALLASDEPLSVDQVCKLFRSDEIEEENARSIIREVLQTIEKECEDRGYELVRVSSGYRFQIPQDLSVWISRLWEQKPPRYTRALLETLSLIAYQQPVTRGDIEQVRGVSVSTNIVRTLLERGWIREVGHREVPGRPVLYATTKSFLDYFNLKSLSELPPLSEIRELVEAGEDKTDSEEQQMDEGSEEAAEIIDGSSSNLSTIESSTPIGNNDRDGAQIVHLTLADK